MKEIFFQKENNKNLIMLLENGILLEKYEDSEDKKRLEGNIYIGKTQNVLKGMQAAFIDVGEDKNTYINMNDLLHKEAIFEEKILIQVKKDGTNKKGARVTENIMLRGRFVVFMPYADFVTISQKIQKKEEKERLIKIVKKFIPSKNGAIIRTSALNKTEEEITNDINQLLKKWEEIKKIFETATIKDIPKLICESDNMVYRFIIDIIDQNIERIVVNNDLAYAEIDKIFEKLEIINIKIDNVNKNVTEIYEIEKQLEQADNRKIYLNCGGFITIDKTEALTAIDVNSGKYTGSKNLEQTVFFVNKEATIEIAKQIRLKDIGGIIVIDYINMDSFEHREKIIEILEKELKKDRSKTQILEFTKLNLLELTRKQM